MSDVLGFVSFGIFIFVFFLTTFNLTKAKRENQKLKIQIINLIQDKQALQMVLDKRDNREIEKTEGFLNFVTQSRDWAFQYIEDVQGGLNKFIKDIEPEIEYFKEYGDVISMEPNYYSLKKITESYEELKKLLPEDEE
jgi:hypothetical protein